MHRPISILRVAAGALAFFVLQSPQNARASGFDVPQIGSMQSGPVTTDAAAIHYNPGQLGYLDRPELSFGAGLIVGRIGYERQRLGQYQYSDNFDFAEPIDPADIDPTRSGTAPKVATTPLGPVGDLFVAIPVLPERFSLGLGLYIPYAAVLNLPDDGPQKWQLQSIFLASSQLTLSAGVKLHDVISIGAGVSYVLSFASLSKVQDFAAVPAFGDGLARPPIGQENSFGNDAPSSVRELDVLARQVDIRRAISHGVSFNAGIALRPTEKLSLAIVYQHGSRQRFKGKFELNMDDDFFTQDLAAQGLRYPEVVEGDAELRFDLPKRITVGAGYRIAPKFALDGFVQYAFYQDFDKIGITFASPDLEQSRLGIPDRIEQDLVRNWKGAVLVELNGRIQATDKVRVSAMLGYHSPASPTSTLDMASPDGHRIVFGTGVGVRINDRFAIYGDFEGQAIAPRKVIDSDYDLGNGTYNMFVSQIGLHGQVFFGRAPTRQSNAAEAGGRPSGPEPGAEAPPAS